MLHVEPPDFRAFCRQVCRQLPGASGGRMGADGVPSIRRQTGNIGSPYGQTGTGTLHLH